MGGEAGSRITRLGECGLASEGWDAGTVLSGDSSDGIASPKETSWEVTLLSVGSVAGG
jgi:hypothetical protein